MPKKNSFTFVEVMIAIAIISILTGTILVTGGPLRNKAKDRKIISDLVTIQNTAMQIYLYEKSYQTVCCETDLTHLVCDQSIMDLCVDIAKYTPIGADFNIKIDGSATAYCAYAGLNMQVSGFIPSAYAWDMWMPVIEGNFFCVDSRGKTIASDTAPNGTCGSSIDPGWHKCDH